MRTTIELPDEMAERLQTIAARRRTTVTSLVLEGLERIYREASSTGVPEGALPRLRTGYHLGGKPLSRDQAHER